MKKGFIPGISLLAIMFLTGGIIYSARKNQQLMHEKEEFIHEIDSLQAAQHEMKNELTRGKFLIDSLYSKNHN